MYQKRLEMSKVRNMRNENKERGEADNGSDIVIFDTGGGINSTITARAWHVFEYTSHFQQMSGYGDKSKPKLCNIVNAATKAWIPGRDVPVIFVVNYATLNEDPDEKESLIVPFEVMRHGHVVDLTPKDLDGEGAMWVDEEYMPFVWDQEKLFFRIEKPNEGELGELEIFELNTPTPDEAFRSHYTSRRRKKLTLPADLPFSEWEKRLALLPEEVIQKTLQNTTHFYLNVEDENRKDPRKHYRCRFPGLRIPRQKEIVASDTFFPTVKSSRGNTCSQFFVGITSDRWEVFPMKKESNNGEALQDYSRKVGLPMAIKTDNAQSEIGRTWTDHCRTHCIKQITTEPKCPHENPAEPKIGQLASMVRNVMRKFKVPLKEHDWAQKWCVDVHNIASSRKLDWRSPLDVSTGYTQDISKFRFHLWEPVWYYQKVKQPNDPWKKARWLGFADSARDKMCYYIKTEGQKPQILIRSIICTRRKNVGTDEEYVNENPKDQTELNEIELGFLTQNGKEIPGDPTNSPVESGEKEGSSVESEMGSEDGVHLGEDESIAEEIDLDETLPPDVRGDPDEAIEELYNEMDRSNDEYEFEKIVDHYFKDGALILKARYWSDVLGEDNILEVPFGILKKDYPMDVARYVKNYVVEKSRRDGQFNAWASKVLKANARRIKRMYRMKEIDRSFRIGVLKQSGRDKQLSRLRLISKSKSTVPRALKKKISKNARNQRKEMREKFGIKIPNNTREALLLDRMNGDNKWAEAIKKEMDALDRLGVFQYHDPGVKFARSDGWQYAPMRMIFDIKHDLRRKARFVVGGHVIDSSEHMTYSSTIKDISVKLMMLIAVKFGLGMMSGDIGNAFCTAPCAEKIWSTCGAEFGKREGAVVVLKRALYGLKTASASFHKFFGDFLRELGFKPSRADQDLWIRKSDEYEGYDYIATHVDDIIIVAKDPVSYMNRIEQRFKVRDVTDSPEYYLGSNLVRRNGKIYISSKKYVKEILRKYQKEHGTIPKETLPLKAKEHPELDETPFLDLERHKEYQHIIGVGQWLIVAGRMDLTYAVCSLSRFSSAPREGHLVLARKIFGYLKKYPKRGYAVNPEPLRIDIDYSDVMVNVDFGNQYSYFHEQIDTQFPLPLFDSFDLNIFVDADHGHDKVTGRSVTGILAVVGSTPVVWLSKRQACVQTSTFGAEFTALKKAVEEAVMLRYYLRSMGIKVEDPTPIYVDNMSVVMNSTNPGSTLNKKNVALAYHFVREHVANNVVQIRKIDSGDNFADPFTKALTSTEFHGFFHECMVNG